MSGSDERETGIAGGTDAGTCLIASLMSTTTALNVPPSSNGSTVATPSKDRPTKSNSTTEPKDTASSSQGADGKAKISAEDITSPLELTNYVSMIWNSFQSFQ